VGVGDTGFNAEPPTNRYASCLNKGNGKILRVNLDGTIPPDNPLVKESAVTSCTTPTSEFGVDAPDRRIFAWGLRNPWRFWIDPHTNLVWIGDVGERQREEITISRGGDHHGYPFFEGTLDFSQTDGRLRLDATCDQGIVPPRPCTPPVHDYPRDAGISVTGGLIPEGCGWSNAFAGKLYYVFADYGADWVRALEVRPDRTGITSERTLDFALFSGGPASIRQGPDQALYVVYHKGGYVARIAPRSMTGPDCHGAGSKAATSPAPGSSRSAKHGGCGFRTPPRTLTGTTHVLVPLLALGWFFGRRARRSG
jgi:glucose/arabinose dehydrogenase